MKLSIHSMSNPLHGRAHRFRMPDDALRHLGIFRGDALWAAPQKDYRDGDIIAVQIGTRIYVRQVYDGGKYLLLETGNPAYLRLSIERNAPGIRLLGKITRALPATA